MGIPIMPWASSSFSSLTVSAGAVVPLLLLGVWSEKSVLRPTWFKILSLWLLNSIIKLLCFFWKSGGNVDNCVLDDDNYLKADLPSAKERLLDLKNGSFRNYQNIFPKYIFLGFASCVLWEVTPSPSPLSRTQKVTFRQNCWLFNAKNKLSLPPPPTTFFYPIPYHQDARGGQNWVFGWSFRRPPFFLF